MKYLFLLLITGVFFSCKDVKNKHSDANNYPAQGELPPISQKSDAKDKSQQNSLSYAKGFSIVSSSNDLTIIKVTSPWPDAKAGFTYALVNKDKMASITLNADAYNAIIAVPVERIVVTSTTHIPALEALGVEDKLVGYPDTKLVSSKATRMRIDAGKIKELGNNNALNTEIVIELQPELIVGFGMNAQNKTYATLQKANIPVIYNGDWSEETPLGKAEWIKFFAALFKKETEADQIFKGIESAYLEAKKLAQSATSTPTVLSGALYKDVWYLPAGKSWSAQFIADANAKYLWANTPGTGSLSLSIESVLKQGKNADFWIAPGQFTEYNNMQQASTHYAEFDAFKHKKMFTASGTMGETGGMLYYELAPQRPDLVLKDLIQLLHPELLPNYEPVFYKPLQ